MAVVFGGHWTVLQSIDSRIELEEKVESALSKAVEHSLRKCEISYGTTNKLIYKENLHTIFRH